MLPISNYLRLLFKKWLNPGGMLKFLLVGILFFLLMISGWLVYVTGGTQYVYINIMYIPIVLAAVAFKLSGGIVAGVFAGLILGPWMPLNVATGQAQATFHWLMRTGFFVMIGFIAGIVFEVLYLQANKLKEQAFYDYRTNLPNRIKLEDNIQSIIESGKINSLALVLLDVENFSDIITNIGHQRAEDFLKEFALYLEKKIDDDVEIYNLYNNKYAFLIKDRKSFELADWLYDFAQNLRSPFQFEEIPIYINSYIGAASFPEHGDSSEELLQKAYVAMHNAEEKGNDYEIIDNNLIINNENFKLLSSVDEALANDQFVVYYQPKIDLKEKRVSGAEALIRWIHPKKGFIPPNDFIPQIEKTALINDLTYWVLKKAIQDLLKLKEKGIEIKIAINISARNLNSKYFLENIVKITEEYDINPKNIELELTETDIMNEIEKSKETLNLLGEKGFEISLDDFGTGYSSLAYLKNLPIDTIKVDRSFVRDILADNRDREIINTAIKMGHIMDKNVIAEGVETQKGLNLLQNMGCDQIQGYFISKPVPYSEFKDWYFNFEMGDFIKD